MHDEVLRATGGKQEPFHYGALGGGTLALAPDVSAMVSLEGAQQQADFEVAMQRNTVEILSAFLLTYPRGPLADIVRRRRDRLLQEQSMAATPVAPPVPLTKQSQGPIAANLIAVQPNWTKVCGADPKAISGLLTLADVARRDARFSKLEYDALESTAHELIGPFVLTLNEWRVEDHDLGKGISVTPPTQSNSFGKAGRNDPCPCG